MSDHVRPVALVTGATRGIGRAVAEDLARTHRVIVHGRDRDVVAALAAALPDAVGWAADLAAGDLADLVPDLDRLDVLVHSAGVIGGDAVDATPVDEWRRVFEINVFAVAEVTRVLLPALRAAKGQVVLVNSGSGFTASPRGGIYAGSKFALRALGDALREEERPHGVRVSSVHPGRVATDMQRELRAKEGGEYDETRYLEPASVARAVRLVVDQTRDGTLESVSLRPFGG